MPVIEIAHGPSGGRFRTFVDESRDEVFIVDRHNRVEYLNPAAIRALGLSEPPIDQSLFRCFPADVAAGLEREINRARQMQKPIYSERCIPFARGERWMSTWLTPIEDADGGRSSVMGVARDITQRHELSQLLARQHQLLDVLIAASPIGIMLVQCAGDWVCELSNPIMRRIAGDERLDGLLLGTACPALAQALAPTLAAAAASEQPVTAAFDVEPRHLSVTAVRVQPPGRSAAMVLALVDDVTSRRELEQQLLHADKMDAIGRLAGGIAHDFNNLLTPILGYTELVASTLTLEDQRRKDLEEVSTAARSATSLTRQLLMFSRKNVTRTAPLDLNEVLRGMNGMLRRTIGEDIHVQIELASSLDRVVADRHQLEQVVMNLCVNARDAMPRGGTLTIRTANASLPHGGSGALGPIPPGDYVLMTIADTGVGIAPDVQTHIFEPFFTTKGPAKGTGLGLSIVHGIVKQAGGAIALTSTVGRGTSFAMYFPRTDAAIVVAQDDASREAPAAASGETVLIVEDHDGLRRLAERLLRAGGYNAVAAQNAGEAIEIADTLGGSIDVLLSDIVMPDVDGITLADQLTRRRPEMRVLFMSGYTGADVARHSVLPPKAALLQKPFTRDALLRAVREVLQGAPA